jgi:hypothetical protein
LSDFLELTFYDVRPWISFYIEQEMAHSETLTVGMLAHFRQFLRFSSLWALALGLRQIAGGLAS